jgi:serpin B
MKLARTVTALLGLAILQSACGQVPVLWGSSPAPACGQGQGTPAGGASQLAAASQSFGLGLARQLAAQPADNVFISPVSAQLALAMAAEGARGDTQRAMLDALGLHQLTADQVARQARLLIDRLTAGGCATVEIANSVWARPWLSLDAGYVRTVKSQFHGQTGTLDGDSPSAINDWAARATHGKITSILERIPPEVLLYVVNATYFHGNWQTAFDPHSTREAPFHRAAGGDVHVPLMDHSGQFRYGEGPGYQAEAPPACWSSCRPRHSRRRASPPTSTPPACSRSGGRCRPTAPGTFGSPASRSTRGRLWRDRWPPSAWLPRSRPPPTSRASCRTAVTSAISPK